MSKHVVKASDIGSDARERYHRTRGPRCSSPYLFSNKTPVPYCEIQEPLSEPRLTVPAKNTSNLGELKLST